MDLMEAIQKRHSVRAYTEKTIEPQVRETLLELVQKYNQESGLHMSIQFDEPAGFASRMARYGNFRQVVNYIILKGKKNEELEERCGYYGEALVLEAQKLGLNTCWVAATFNKSGVKTFVPEGEKLCMVIALGYGQTEGVPHKGKNFEGVTEGNPPFPEWFKKGVEAALLAPTAINQQKFKISLVQGVPQIRVSGLGIHTRVDLGIVKYHFEVGANQKFFHV